MTMIERRYGICRTVYLIGPWAIKTPRFRRYRSMSSARRIRQVSPLYAAARGLLANESEAQWSDVPGVAPVLHTWLWGFVNVYPRCEAYPSSGPEPDYDNIGEGWIPRDRKRDNIGVLDGKLVWIDYDGSWNGCPHTRNAANLSESDDE